MAGSVNKVILVGNLGRDPEVKRMPSGDAMVQLSVATSETWRDKNTGEKRDRTEWHRVVIFNDNLAKVAENYLRKGTRIYVEGQLQTRKWQDQQGQDRYSTEIVLQKYRGELQILSARGEESGGYAGMEDRSDDAGFAPASGSGNRPSGGGGERESFPLDDEIPF